MKKFLARFGKTRFMILCFILLVAINYCYNGRIGAIAATIGWCLGALIYNWKEYEPRIIKFLRRMADRLGARKFRMLFSTIFCLPILAYFTYTDGLKGFIVSAFGIFVGHLISNKFIFKD